MVLLGLTGCQTVSTNTLSERLIPSNHRDWRPDFAKLAYADFEDDGEVTVHNVRNCAYITEDVYVVNHDDRQYNLKDVTTVDFIVVPFRTVPSLAHTMLSFGFRDGRYLVVSVEVRLEKGEKYSPLLGSARQFEIMYVVGDERDLIQLRTQHRKVDVYVYRAKATPEQVQALFLDVMQRVNKLANEPEFYDTLTNNCTTNIVRHVNRVNPGRIPFDLGVMLPGLSDRMAYDLGLLDTTAPFEQAKRQAWVNELAERHQGSPDFSSQIRR